MVKIPWLSLLAAPLYQVKFLNVGEALVVKHNRRTEVLHNIQSTPEMTSRSSFLCFSLATLLATTWNPSPSNAIAETKNSDPRTALTSQQRKTLEESISGFVAGAALTSTKTFVKYPLDTATVRLQMPGTAYTSRDLQQLFDGSFRGITLPLLSNVPAGAVFFAVKDASKSAMSEFGLPKWVTTSLAVAIAQFPYWLVRNPSEVVKTRQQAGIQGYGKGVPALEALRLVQQEALLRNQSGVGALYTGYWENIVYAFPADVIKFVCYDVLTKGRNNVSPAEGAVAGAVSTGVAQLVTTPLDVVRNRVMALSSASNGEKLKDSYLQSLAKLAREEGIAGLFAGSSPRVGKAVLSGAIQFATYEETKQALMKLLLDQHP
jgi:hypothetical protein